MVKEKIKIKKIDNAAARQVTFSKRRGGLFKKAKELSVLCDAEVAVLIFSSNGKHFEYASSRRMRGEELQGLSIEELQHLEGLIEAGLNRVIEKKGQKIMDQINELEEKQRLLVDENDRLKRRKA